MVDFPEGYGFEPGGKAMLMHEKFHIEVGQFSRADYHKGQRRRSPWTFTAIGYVFKAGGDAPILGKMYTRIESETLPRVEGTLQQVVTALCTLHRMRGHMK